MFLLVFLCSTALYTGTPSAKTQSEVDSSAAISETQRLSLARDFLRKVKSGFAAAESFLSPSQGRIIRSTNDNNVLPEGEELLLDVYLPGRLQLDGVIAGQVRNNDILLSLKDLVAILDFPITINSETNTAQGWFIRENRSFALDLSSKSAVVSGESFSVPDDTYSENGDIFVTLDSIEQWFGLETKVDVSALQLFMSPSTILPIQERIARAKKNARSSGQAEAELPLLPQPKQLIDVPFVDVATNSRYDRRGESGRSTTSHNVNIRTAGDFAYGTLTTQTQINDEDNINNIRLNYKQESLEPELLGPLKAKRFEVGDLLQTRLPIDSNISQELGVRVTNADPLRSLNSPTTAITGTVFPGWDVELYRGNQFLGFQRVGDDGFYSFDNVILFSNENIFRVVLYGPQGEVREEEISIPVDINLLAEGGGVYDVSLTFNGEQTYNKNSFEDEDEGTPTLMALYEKPLGGGTVGSVAFRSDEQNGERNYVGYGGISTLFGETLINANAAIDDEADLAAELVARRNIGTHDIISTTEFFTDGYDTIQGGDDTIGLFNTRFNANGQLPFGPGRKPRYSTSLDYQRNTDGDSRTTGTLGFNTTYKNFAFSDDLTYTTQNTGADDTLDNTTAITGTFGSSRVRLRSDYEVKPDSRLRRVALNYNYDFSNKLDLDVDLERTLDPSVTEAAAQLNWQAGWARISPSVRYNTENDFFAGLNTNFGLLRDPQINDIRSFDRSVTSNGGISVLVFLDQNGDGVMNENEKPLEDISVRALQNGGHELTNENGIAFFKQVRELRRTDVIIEDDSLEDPFWISGFDGVSVLPREGYVVELQYPIHISSELDGTLYARGPFEKPRPVRNVPIHLYNGDGEIEDTAMTDVGGFYLFTRVPPGRYLLVVDQKAAENSNFARPKPQPIELGYDGTIIYGNDVFVEANEKDIPSTILSGLEDYTQRHPHIDFENSDYNIVLNLGDYNSRLLMSTVWYRMHTRYRQILAGGHLMVLPQYSFADIETGKHTLRVGFYNIDIDDAYNRCRALIARDIACQVEVLPRSAQKLAMQNTSEAN